MMTLTVLGNRMSIDTTSTWLESQYKTTTGMA